MNLKPIGMIPQIYSPSRERINELKKLKEDKEKGIYSGIPLWESMPSFAEIVPTLEKGQVVLMVAHSGVGKSMITRFLEIYVPWMFVRKHPELEIDLKFVIFLLEDDIKKFKDYLIAFLLFKIHNVKVNPQRLKSSYKEPLSQDIIDKIDALEPVMDDLLNRCIIEDSIYNAYGIYKRCRILSEQWGIHYYVDMINDTTVISRSDYNKLPSLPDHYDKYSIDDLKRIHNINPLEYKEFYKYSHYIPNNPKQHVITITDNINCLNPEKGDSLKDAMDKYMYTYLRTNMAKHWQWTCVAVQQFVGGAEEQQFDVRGNSIIEKTIPNLSMLGDSKLTQRAAHLILALWEPLRYGIKEFKGYNIKRLGDTGRFLFLLKNNDGKSNMIFPLFFVGESSYFKELPVAEKIEEKIYLEIEQGKYK